MKLPVILIKNNELKDEVGRIVHEISRSEEVPIFKVINISENSMVMNEKGLACIPRKRMKDIILENPAIYIFSDSIELRVNLKEIITITETEDIKYLEDDLRLGVKIAKFYSKLPKIDCKECGRKTCLDFAIDLALNKADIKECVTLFSKKRLVIKVDDEVIFLKPWVQDLVRKTILTMLSSLKGVRIKGDEKLMIEVKEH